MTDRRRATRTSKFLSLVLRHQPSAAGMILDAEGWADIDDLLAGAAGRGFAFSRSELDEVVRSNDKRRFEISPDGQRIRASHGHSVPVDLGLQAAAPPETLYHGTVERFLSSIFVNGLEKRDRQHVHLSPDIPTATQVGARRGPPVILSIAAGDMHRTGFRFFRSGSGVWLTERIPPRYVSLVQD